MLCSSAVQPGGVIGCPLAEPELVLRRSLRVSFAPPCRRGGCSLAGIHLSSSALGYGGETVALRQPDFGNISEMQQSLVASVSAWLGVSAGGGSNMFVWAVSVQHCVCVCVCLSCRKEAFASDLSNFYQQHL